MLSYMNTRSLTRKPEHTHAYAHRRKPERKHARAHADTLFDSGGSTHESRSFCLMSFSVKIIMANITAMGLLPQSLWSTITSFLFPSLIAILNNLWYSLLIIPFACICAFYSFFQRLLSIQPSPFSRAVDSMIHRSDSPSVGLFNGSLVGSSVGSLVCSLVGSSVVPL